MTTKSQEKQLQVRFEEWSEDVNWSDLSSCSQNYVAEEAFFAGHRADHNDAAALIKECEEALSMLLAEHKHCLEKGKLSQLIAATDRVKQALTKIKSWREE